MLEIAQSLGVLLTDNLETSVLAVRPRQGGNLSTPIFGQAFRRWLQVAEQCYASLILLLSILLIRANSVRLA